MKNEQRLQARELFFQAGLTKSEIAERIGVSRRSIYQWSVDGNWDKLRQSSRNMPAILAEKCYYLIGQLTDHLLSTERCLSTVTKAEVDTLHKLIMSVNRLKQGSTVSENMETFTHFLERVQRADPELAEDIAPHVTNYIVERRSKSETSFLLQGFDESGRLPFNADDLAEKWLDEEEQEAIAREAAASQAPRPAEPTSTQPTANSTSTDTSTDTSTSTSNRLFIPAQPHAIKNSSAEAAQLSKPPHPPKGFLNSYRKARPAQPAAA